MSLRRALKLTAEVERLRSLEHHDSAAFEADLRVGAKLVINGHVLATRVKPPPQVTSRSLWSRSVAPWADNERLPLDHPRRRETPESSKALRLAELWGRPWR